MLVCGFKRELITWNWFSSLSFIVFDQRVYSSAVPGTMPNLSFDVERQGLIQLASKKI